jgi:hypothetical protein
LPICSNLVLASSQTLVAQLLSFIFLQMFRLTVIFLFIIPSLSFCQGKKGIIAAEKYLRNQVEDLQFIFHNRQYSGVEIDSFFDEYVDGFLDRPLPNQNGIKYAPYYKERSKFKYIIDEIDLLGDLKGDYFSREGDTIRKLIYSLTNIGERQKALVHLQMHFPPSDSSFKSIGNDLLQNSIDKNLFNQKTVEKKLKNGTFPYNEYGEMQEAIGDFSLSFGSLKEALSYYLMSAYLYDSLKNYSRLGYIEDKIGNLYLTKPYELYKLKAIDHFKRASKVYDFINDTINSITEDLKAVQLQFETYNPNFNLLEIGSKFADKILSSNLSLKTISFNDIEQISEENRISNDDSIAYKLLSKARHAFDFYDHRDKNGDLNFYACTLTGEYFSKKEELEIATKYFQMALLCATVRNYSNYNARYFKSALCRLSLIYALRKDFAKADLYIEQAIKYSAKEYNIYDMAWYQTVKGNQYSDMGYFSKAIDVLKKVETYVKADNKTFFGDKKNTILGNIYSALKRAYDSTGNTSLANYYSSLSNSIYANTLNNIEELNEVENEFVQVEYEQRLNKELQKITALGTIIKSKNLEIQKSDSVLEGIKIALSDSQKTLTRLHSDISIAKIDLDAQKRKLNFTYEYTGIAIGVLLIAIGISFWLYKVRIKRKNEKIQYTRAELNTLTKGKLHNTKSKYNGFLILIKKEPLKAIEYATKSVSYLEVALNDVNWESLKWTIGEEWDLLKLYYEAEKIRWPNIDIKPEFNDDVRHSRFLTEVFTTLLDNSIIHGFQYKKKGDECFFIVKIIRNKSWLHFEVIDNGITQEGTVYLSRERQNRGLGLLKTRIETEIKMQNQHKKGLDFFSANRNNFGGTTIKFILPYAIST